MSEIPDKTTLEIQRVANGFIVTLPPKGKSDIEVAMGAIMPGVMQHLDKLNDDDDPVLRELLKKKDDQEASLPTEEIEKAEHIFVFDDLHQVLFFLKERFGHWDLDGE